MGKSSRNGKKVSFSWVSENKENINFILDIGAGSGTYFNLLSGIKEFYWDAVEVWKPYIDKFKLETKYNNVYNSNIKNFNWVKKYDLVIAGDILEHLSKEEAIEVVSNVLNNSKFMLISIPIVDYPQGEENGNPYEVHIKDDWSHNEMVETFGNYIKKSELVKDIGVYWLEK